jgi:hypothetical protein
MTTTYSSSDSSVTTSTTSVTQPVMTSAYAQYKPPAGEVIAECSYSVETAPTAQAASKTLESLELDITTTTGNPLVSGSVLFTYAGNKVLDRNGFVYRNVSASTDSGTQCGTINYETGKVTLTNWEAGANNLEIKAAATSVMPSYVYGVTGRAPGAPLATGQFQLVCVASDGTNIVATANNNGDISHEFVKGKIDWQTGIFKCQFGKKILASTLTDDQKASAGWYKAELVGEDGYIWKPRLVKSESITFNAVLLSYIPLDADILGVETVRLPQDGRVPIYRVGNVGVVHNTQNIEVTNPATAGLVVDCGRTLLSYAKVFDADDQVVPTSKYTADLDAGTVTFATPLDLTGYAQPLRVEHRIEDMALISDVQITGDIKLMKPLRHAYPALTTYLSSALVIGDMQARINNLFDQQTWSNVFSDTLSGSVAAASFNDVLYPIATTNAGAIQERWAIVFTGSTAFNLYGEYSGLVASGTTGADFAPINPITGVPYFELNHLGWGSGWAAGNVLRFNTIAANYPLWLARTTLQSDPAVYTDHFKLQIRGDAN